jgi:hypothetical protein
LLDRLSPARRGIPVVDGAYFSQLNGSITGEFLDLINSGCLYRDFVRSFFTVDDGRACEFIKRKFSAPSNWPFFVLMRDAMLYR